MSRYETLCYIFVAGWKSPKGHITVDKIRRADFAKLQQSCDVDRYQFPHPHRCATVGAREDEDAGQAGQAGAG